MPTYHPSPTDPYSPESASTANIDSTSATPSSSSQSTFGPNQQYSNILPDMADIMFPSADPFAYPNQPMMTLEDQNLFRPENTNVFSASDTPATTRGPYGAFDTQFFGSWPPYMMQFPENDLGFQTIGTSSDISSVAAGNNAMALEGDSAAWPSDQMQQSSGASATPTGYDDPYGQGWANQSYQQS